MNHNLYIFKLLLNTETKRECFKLMDKLFVIDGFNAIKHNYKLKKVIIVLIDSISRRLLEENRMSA